VDLKNTTPEDIARTTLPHFTYLLQRQVLSSKFTQLKNRLRRHVGVRVRQMRRRRTKAI
jgi:hypothetical protein